MRWYEVGNREVKDRRESKERFQYGIERRTKERHLTKMDTDEGLEVTYAKHRIAPSKNPRCQIP